jgi:hypothetical protein
VHCDIPSITLIFIGLLEPLNFGLGSIPAIHYKGEYFTVDNNETGELSHVCAVCSLSSELP